MWVITRRKSIKRRIVMLSSLTMREGGTCDVSRQKVFAQRNLNHSFEYSPISVV